MDEWLNRLTELVNKSDKLRLDRGQPKQYVLKSEMFTLQEMTKEDQ